MSSVEKKNISRLKTCPPHLLGCVSVAACTSVLYGMYDVYIDRVDVHVGSPPGATPAGRGAAGILGVFLLLLLLLPPVHTGVLPC